MECVSGSRPRAAISWSGGKDCCLALGCTHVIFGDIFEDTHRAWTERICGTAGLIAVQPLWGESTDVLVREFIDRGGEARLVTVREEHLDASWLGQPLSLAVVDELTARGIDPAGERGEYHSVVTGCPLFKSPLHVIHGAHVQHRGCRAIDLAPETPTMADHASV